MSAKIEDIIDSMPMEPIISIDVDYIDEQSVNNAKNIIKDIIALYYDEKWIEEHPQYKARIEIELETLRGLLKMRQADEQAHDALLIGISGNNGNASLYRALSEIQKTSLAITTKINESITSLTELIKLFQLDAPADNESDEEYISMKNVHRGSKDFIKTMNTAV